MPDAPAVTPVTEGTVPWPEEAVREYVARGWWRGRALGTELWSAADARPDAPAVIDGAVRLTYRSVTVRADALAAKLTDDLGLRRGDRIVVQLPNCWQFTVLLLGCLRAGIIPVMALPAHRRHELAYLVGHSEAVAIAVPGAGARLRPPEDGGRAGGRLPDATGRADDERDRPGRVYRSHRPVRRAGAGGRARRPAAVGCRPARQPRGRAVPAVRRHHRPAQAHRADPRRLRLQRARQRRAVRARAGHGVPDGAAGVAQLPAGLPGHPGHPAVRRPRRHAAVAGARAVLRRHRRRGGHRHRRRARGRAAVDQARPGARRRPVAHADAAAGRRRAAGRRDRPPGPAGPGLHPAAGVRHGRGAAELHPPGRPGRRHLHHPGPAAQRG